MINPAGKNIVIDRAAPPLEPDQQAGPSVLEQFELNRATCFLLHHHCPRSDLPAADKVANLHLHQVAAPELAVDRQIEQRSISQPATLIEVNRISQICFGFKARFVPTVHLAQSSSILMPGVSALRSPSISRRCWP